MVRSHTQLLVVVSTIIVGVVVHGWSQPTNVPSKTSRRDLLYKVAGVAFVASTGTLIAPESSIAATTTTSSGPPEVITTANGIKYATIKKATGKGSPINKDIVAIEYTGYLTDGTIFDATHAEGKQKALAFEVGGNAVIEGLNEMVKEMEVGQKVQAIIPPKLAFGDKGICIENGECLVKPKSYLVYDIYLKRSAIAPP